MSSNPKSQIPNPKSQVRVRFAPSPTGELHIGGARTALFNYLFSRQNKGKFLLRIEDTDRQRFVPGASERIIDSLLWLGLKFDGKSMVQSERLEIYQKKAQELIKKDLGYFCFCSKERLERLRKTQVRKKEPPRYDRKCRNLSQGEVRKRVKKGESYVIRLKVPKEGSLKFNDLIRGKIEFQLKEIDDSIILKSDGYPTYYLASVVDDKEMGISHVIRGEEWLSSTPKNILIFNAFGWSIPKYAHIPLTLNPDRTKLSKRFGAVSIPEFREKGYLPEALINFMVFLGWNPKTEEEIFIRGNHVLPDTIKPLETLLGNLINKFDLKDCGKSAAIFDLKKLNWMNAWYIKNISTNVLQKYLAPFMKGEQYKVRNLEDLLKLSQRGDITRLDEFTEKFNFLIKELDYKPSLLIFKKSTKEKTLNGLELGAKSLKQINEKYWKIDKLHKALSSVAQSPQLNFGDIFWPIRVALSGKEASPSPEELLWVLGKEESLKRIKKAISLLK